MTSANLLLAWRHAMARALGRGPMVHVVPPPTREPRGTDVIPLTRVDLVIVLWHRSMENWLLHDTEMDVLRQRHYDQRGFAKWLTGREGA